MNKAMNEFDLESISLLKENYEYSAGKELVILPEFFYIYHNKHTIHHFFFLFASVLLTTSMPNAL